MIFLYNYQFFTLFNKETIHINKCELLLLLFTRRGFTTLRNGVLSGWICPDIRLHRPKCTRGKANVCVQIISTRLSVNSRIDEDTHIKKCLPSGDQRGPIKIFFLPQESNK